MCSLMQKLFNMWKFNLKVLYYDNDLSTEPMTFRDVFLRSQAIEGVTLSMVSWDDLSQLLICKENFHYFFIKTSIFCCCNYLSYQLISL